MPRKPKRARTPTLLQFENAECGAVALGIVLHYYQCYIPIEELRVKCGVSRNGSNALNIVKAAQQYGMVASGVRRSSLDSLRTLPIPLIIYWNFNHFVVYEGASPDQVYINDPSSGPRTITLDEFNRAFTGLAIICKPGSQFQKRGHPFNLIEALRQRLKGLEGGLLFVVFVSLLLLLPGFALANFLRIFVDNILGSHHDMLGLILLGMAATFVATGLLTWAEQYCLLRLETALSLRTSKDFFWHILHLPVSFFAQRLSGDLVGRVQLNQRIAQLLSSELATATINTLLILFYGLFMLQYDVLLSLISFAFVGLNFAAFRYASRARRDANQRLLQEKAKLSGATTNTLQAIESLKAAGMESSSFVQWADLQIKTVNAEQELGYISALVFIVPYFLALLNTAVILTLGSQRIISGPMTIGMLVAFQSLSVSFMRPISQLTSLGGQLQEAEGSLSRLFDVLQNPIETNHQVNGDSPISTPQLSGGLSINNLSFGYSLSDPPLLDAINLNLKPGEQIALVGASGSGKSTIAKLIAGLYQPWTGDIMFDDKPRQAIAPHVLDNALTMVDQTIVLFSGTVWDNLTLWDQTVPLEKVVAAAQDACIHEVIMARPDGYNSLLEEGGVNLSGGERQRLELARALVHNPTLLVLDEATSALDMITEGQILDNLRQRGCSCVVIAHRSSAIHDCEQIVMLDAGRIVWTGTYPQFIYRSQVEQDNMALPILGQSTVHDLYSASELETMPDLPAHLETTEKLAQAFHQIFQAFKLDISFDQIRLQIQGGEQPIVNIAHGFHFRARQVTLTTNWWQTSYGPLLGYWQSTGSPVALLTDRFGRYTLFDPEKPLTQKPIPLTSTLAASLQNTAYCFYKPLPNRVIKTSELLHYIAPFIRLELGASIGLVLIVGLLSILAPLITGLIVDKVIPEGNYSHLLVLGAVLVTGAVAASVMNVLSALAVLRMEGKVDGTLQSAIWDRLLRLPASFFRLYSVGDLAERAMSISRMRVALADVGILLLVGLLFAVFNSLLLFSYNIPFASVMIGLVVVYVAALIILGQRQLQYQRQELMLDGQQRSLALQFVMGIAKLRVAGAESRAYDRWIEKFTLQQTASYAAKNAQNRVTIFMAAYPVAAITLMFFISSEINNLSLGQFLTFNAAFVQLMFAGSQFGRAFSKIQTVLPLLGRLEPILRMVPEVTEHHQRSLEVRGQIYIRHISFRYSPTNPYVIDNLSLTLVPGECVAIISASGAGKSTLLRLLLGFEKPERGEIYFDGQPISTLDMENVRSQIGTVLQNGSLVAGDVFTNIVGARNLSMADAWRAARLAAIEDDIKKMPMGMNTYLNEGQYALSGGQIQRLLIARALVSRPKLIFFDEATSSIDDQNQRLIMQNLKHTGASRLIIAHRLSTIRDADRVLVLEKGRLVRAT